MNYYYYQLEGGNEPWKPVPESHLAQFTQDAMFVTVLSVDSPIADDATKEQLNGIKYNGPLYFDLDDAESPASTAIDVVELISKLQDLQVNPYALRIFATGGKGFHVLVSPTTFLTKAPAKGLPLLPIIFKEIAYKLAVKSLDLRVYTARKGRMFRQPNIERPNGKYKVPITYDTLVQMAELAKTDPQAAKEQYDQLCSAPSDYHFIEEENPALAPGLLALFDECKTKIQSLQRTRKAKPVKLPETLPSFEMLLRGEGIKPDVGFHQIALQAAITAHATGMPLATFLASASGLCENHHSDGYRYNTASKRRAELARMFDYTEDNPCYEYSAGAVGSLLTHPAMDMRGVEMTEDEVLADMEFGLDEYSDEYEHAGLTLTASGAYVATEHGQKRILAMGFEDVTELVSADTGSVSTVSASVKVGGKPVGVKVMDLANFNSVANMNKMVMPLGQAFMGNDNHARGLYMRLVEKARKGKRRMYALSREGLDYINLPFHEKEELRNDFLVWGDCERVITQPNVAAAEVNFKFIGFPMERGQFQTDLSQAPPLVEWISDPENKERMRRTMHALFSAQDPSYYGKIIGWMIACMYRMMFHKAYSKFPLLHVNGAAGAGKTEGVKLLTHFHYFRQEPKMLTPTSTLFAVQYAASGSASIPLILDEFKPSEMDARVYDRFKLLLRDAYNCRNVERGGGTRDNADYRAVHQTALSAPICFIAEAAESESALMERVVLLTLIKPPVVQAQKYLRNFIFANDNRDVLGIIGNYMAAQIVKRYSIDQLKAEFSPVYNDTRMELMLQDGEERTLSGEQLRMKLAAKERTVFNYAVVRFGLSKLENLLHAIFGEEFTDTFHAMRQEAVSSVNDLQTQTIPEWLKVMNTFADLAKHRDDKQYALMRGEDYAFLARDGKECIEFYARSCYNKYRIYCGMTRTRPLYPSEAAFIHALNAIPALVERNSVNGELSEVPGGSHIFDLDTLRGAGFVEPRG